ncbi:hypothetical protein RUND412_007499 [Rhizina undulata]
MDKLFGEVLDKVKASASGYSNRQDDEPGYGNQGGNHGGNHGRSGEDYRRDEGGYSDYNSGYGNNEGRSGEYSRGDHRGYSREEGYQHQQDYGDNERRNQEEYGGSGYGGHGGRPQTGRYEEELDSSRREYRAPQQSGVYPPHHPHDDLTEARHVAERHSGSQESSLFSSALSFLSGREKQLSEEDIDETDYVDRHRKMYSNEQIPGSSKSIGTAAAMQALKAFTGGKGEAAQKQDSKTFIGLAMGECVKLFDQQSNKGQLAQGANKQEAVNTAAQMAMKLFLKSKVSSSSGGSSGSSDMLMSLASRLMK